MGDILSANEAVPCQPGQVVVDVGGNTWVSWANGSSHAGCLIGICQAMAFPGGPISVATQGRVPYAQFNLGAGQSGTLQVDVTGKAKRGGQTGGQVIGTCDPAGALFLWPSYVGTIAGSNAPVAVFASGAVQSSVPSVGQAPVWDGSKFAWDNVVSGSSGFPSGTGLVYTAGGHVNPNAVTLTQDVSQGALSGSNVPLTVVGLQTKALPALPGSQEALAYTGSAWTFLTPGAFIGSTISGTGFWFSSSGSLDPAAATLTGDISQGAISSNNVPLTVTGAQGKALPSLPGSQQFLGYSGSAWNFTSATSISALTTYGGDISATSTASAQYIQSISFSSAAAGGAVGIHGTGTTFVIDAGNTGFSLTQTNISTVGATAANLTFGAQQNTAGTGSTGKSGNIIFNVGAPPGTSTTEAFVQFNRNNSPLLYFGADPGAPGDTGIWFAAQAGGGPNGSNFGFLANSAQTYLRGPSYIFLISTSYGVELNDTLGAFEPAGTVGAGNTILGSTTYPWNQAWANGYFFTAAATTPQLMQQTQSNGGAAPPNLVIQPQWQFGTDQGSVAKNTPASVIVSLGPPYIAANTGSEPYLVVERNSIPIAWLGADPSFRTTFGGLWLGPSLTPSNVNFCMLSDGTTTYVQGGGSVNFQTGFGTIFSASSSGVIPGSVNYPLGSATDYWLGVFSNTFQFPAGLGANGLIEWSGVNPSTTGNNIYVLGQGGSVGFPGGNVVLVSGNGSGGSQAAGGVALLAGSPGPGGANGAILMGYGASGVSNPPNANQVTFTLSSTQWIIATQTPSANQNPYDTVFKPQAAANQTGATVANNTPGSFVVAFATPGSTTNQGLNAAFKITDNGNQNQCWIGSYGAVSGGSTAFSVIWLGPNITPSSTNYTFASNNSSVLDLNAPGGGQMNFLIGGTAEMIMTTAALQPNTVGGLTLGNAATPWGGSYLAGTTSNSVVSYNGFLPLQGTIDVQRGFSTRNLVVLKTTNTSAANLESVTVNNSTGVVIKVIGAGRCTSVGGSSFTLAQTVGLEWHGTFYASNTGVMTQQAAGFVWQDSASLTSVQVNIATANTVTIQVISSGPGGTPTIDWQFEIQVIYI